MNANQTPPPPDAAPSGFNDTGSQAAPPPGGDEQVSQHGKRAAIVAAVLGALVVGGLLVDSLRGASPAAAPAPDAARPTVPQDPFVDFEAKQRMEAARLEAERQKKLAQDQARREAQAQALRESPPAGAEAPPLRSPEQELRDTARLEDLKRALAAVSSQQMLVTSARERGASGGAQAVSASASGVSGSGTRAGAPAAPNHGDSTLARLRQAIDRVRGGNGAADGDALRYVRDLRGPEAAATVAGQSVTARRERGEAQRPGEYLIPVGTVMSAVLDIEINSDWEGRWRAMITRDVYDLSQDVILIPKGTRVLGTSARPKPVNEAINERMALVAQWLVLPNGARIDLSRSSMLDSAGVAALDGDVNRHFLATLGGVAAYGVIGGWAAAQAVKETDTNNLGLAAAALGGRSAGAEIALGMADIGRRVAARYLNLVPTITVRPGTPMSIFLDDEMLLQAWAPIDEFAPEVAPPPMR